MAITELISKDFLEKILGRKVDTFRAEAGSESGDNYMSVLHAIDVQCAAKDDKKEETLHLLSKCYPSNPARQKFLNKANIFFKELIVYKDYVAELINFQLEMGVEKIIKPAFPPFVAGDAVDFVKLKEQNNNKDCDKVYGPFDNYIMMTDLRKSGGFRMGNRLTGFDKDHMSLAVTALAEVHALSWVYKQKKAISKITEKFPTMCMDFGDPEDKKMWTMVMDMNAKTTVDSLTTSVGEDSPLVKATKDYQNIMAEIMEICYGEEAYTGGGLDKLLRVPITPPVGRKEDNWRIVIHGDFWVNNMLFRYDEQTGRPEEIIIVDLQVLRESCPTMDLVYLVYTSTDAAFRKNHLDEVLQIYFDRFNGVCQHLNASTLPGFSMEELKFRFNRGKLFGYSMAMLCLPIMLKEKKDVADLETIEGEIDDFMIKIGADSSGNIRYNERMLGVAQEMYDEGII